MIIALTGKGGVGKTTLTAILLDELLRRQFVGKILVVDADPVMTLAPVLGVTPPAWTVTDLHDSIPLETRRRPGLPLSAFIRNKLIDPGLIVRRCLRSDPFDLLLMGPNPGSGCRYLVNAALAQALTSVYTGYDLVIIDSDASLGCLNRYPLPQIDLFTFVLTPARSSWLAADRLKQRIDLLDLELGETWLIYNRTRNWFAGQGSQNTLLLPHCETIAALDRQGGPLLALVDDHPLRLALAPLVERIDQMGTKKSLLESASLANQTHPLDP